jgi:hypothetical protein
MYNIYKASVSPGSVQQICPISSSFRYDGSLGTWTAVCSTAAKFKPLIIDRVRKKKERNEEAWKMANK